MTTNERRTLEDSIAASVMSTLRHDVKSNLLQHEVLMVDTIVEAIDASGMMTDLMIHYKALPFVIDNIRSRVYELIKKELYDD